MDDLKLYAEGKSEMVRVTEGISGAVGMEFGFQKCAVAHMRNGRTRRGGCVDLGGRVSWAEMTPINIWGWPRCSRLSPR